MSKRCVCVCDQILTDLKPTVVSVFVENLTLSWSLISNQVVTSCN